MNRRNKMNIDCRGQIIWIDVWVHNDIFNNFDFWLKTLTLSTSLLQHFNNLLSSFHILSSRWRKTKKSFSWLGTLVCIMWPLWLRRTYIEVRLGKLVLLSHIINVICYLQLFRCRIRVCGCMIYVAVLCMTLCIYKYTHMHVHIKEIFACVYTF